MPTCYLQRLELPVKPGLLTDLQQQATPERLEQAMRYRQDEDKARCLLGERLLVQALTEQGIAQDEQKITRNEFGKPVLVNSVKDCHFNISHSGEWVVCAIDNQLIGIDVEQIRKQRSMDIADNGGYDKLFTAMELDYLKNHQQGTITQRFYRLWTLKESYLKAVGTGLTQSLQSFSVEIIDKHHARLWLAGELQPDWYFYSFEPAEGYCCSVCSKELVDTDKIFFG